LPLPDLADPDEEKEKREVSEGPIEDKQPGNLSSITKQT